MTSRPTALLLMLCLTGCPEQIKRPASEEFVLFGVVYLADGEGRGRGEPLMEATVRAAVDRNGDGAISAEEAVSATTDEEGKYRLSRPVSLGETVVVSVRAEGAAPVLRTYRAGPKAELELSPTLRPLEILDCGSDLECMAGDDLKLGGLPSGMGGGARVFNPVTETAAFPGGFNDDKGNLLVSGVFSAIELTDPSGAPVEKLSSPAQLKLALPKETWRSVVDLSPGTDRIEVPLFAFHEASGQWKREGQGHLETEAGALLAEAKLPSLRDGTLPGKVNVSGPVSHFSYWNVDWPIESHACLSGVVVGDDDQPAEGATVLIRGLSYQGGGEGQTVGKDGRFCAHVMRSEGPEEDVDQNNKKGDSHQVGVRISYAGVLFEAGSFTSPRQAATCGGACLDLGRLKLTKEKEVSARVCPLQGKVVDSQGSPSAGALVYAFDESLPEQQLSSRCGPLMLNCQIITTAGADGSFALKVPMLDRATVAAVDSSARPPAIDSSRVGMMSLEGCPSAPIQVKLTEGFDQFEVSVTLAAGKISWTPAKPAQRLVIYDAAGGSKWEVEGPAQGLSSPISYGVLPAGATQLSPTGTPGALASGDVISIELDGVGADGYAYAGRGSTTAP